MNIKALFFGITLMIAYSANAFQIANKPLRTLNPGSEVYASVDSGLVQLSNDAFYQEGQRVLFGISLDELKPYCHVKSYSQIPMLKDRSKPLKLTKIEGGVLDQQETSFSLGNFSTNLDFSNQDGSGDIFIECFKQSKESFNEATLSDFNTVFGHLLRFGKLDLSDEGLEVDSALFPEYHVLEPKLLRENILFETDQELVLKALSKDNWATVEIIEGSTGYHNNFSKPYCSLFIIQEPGETPVDVVIPSGTKLRVTGDIVGNYNKLSDGLEFGFSTMMDLNGFDKPIRLYCNSLDSAKPLRYSGLRSILGDVLSVAYTN